jgi:excisionase family DNA binding protein
MTTIPVHLPKFYTIKEVSEHLRVCVNTVRNFLKEGKLSATKIGNQWRISEQSLQAFLDEAPSHPNPQAASQGKPLIEVLEDDLALMDQQLDGHDSHINERPPSEQIKAEVIEWQEVKREKSLNIVVPFPSPSPEQKDDSVFGPPDCDDLFA